MEEFEAKLFSLSRFQPNAPPPPKFDLPSKVLEALGAGFVCSMRHLLSDLLSFLILKGNLVNSLSRI